MSPSCFKVASQFKLKNHLDVSGVVCESGSALRQLREKQRGRRFDVSNTHKDLVLTVVCVSLRSIGKFPCLARRTEIGDEQRGNSS